MLFKYSVDINHIIINNNQENEIINNITLDDVVYDVNDVSTINNLVLGN